jgi:hypothetical protein
MAMGINNVYALDAVEADDFIAMCAKLGISWRSMKDEGLRLVQSIVDCGMGLVEQMALIGFEEQASSLYSHIKEGALRRGLSFN